ncbi:hypothetical protein ACFQXA_31020 [Nocardiopsis composta]
MLAVDEYVRMRRTVPGFGVLDFDPPEPEEDASCRPLPRPGGNALVAERLLEVGTAVLGEDRDPATDRRVLVAVEAADAVLALAFRTDPGAPRNWSPSARTCSAPTWAAPRAEHARPPRSPPPRMRRFSSTPHGGLMHASQDQRSITGNRTRGL